MAEFVLGSLLSELVSTEQQVWQGVRLVTGVKKEVETLANNLSRIQVDLEEAESRQVRTAITQRWLENLKQVSYEIKHVLDDWGTEPMKQQVEEIESEGKIALAKVCFSISCGFLLFRRVNSVHKLARKIKELNGTLDSIAEEKKMFDFQYTARGIKQHEPYFGSLFIGTSVIFGLENEKRILLSMLSMESTGVERVDPFVVIAIVGMGGIGKTTLSQLAYNDAMVDGHFRKKIWVCVSNLSDEKIAKAIIEGLNENDTPISLGEWEPLLHCIGELVEGKKFLLVLDDVWNLDNTKWKQLKSTLQNGAIGSRILVTTRKEEAAIMMGATTHLIRIKELSEENCLSLFYHFASFDGENHEFNVFEPFAKKLVNKCKGLPLAAKALGTLMRHKKTMRQWRDVLDSKIWEYEVFEHQVFQPLLRSYYDLASAIKPCLLYCATFPKDYKFDKDNLIELWMSQDYLHLTSDQEHSTSGQEYEITGQRFFHTLVTQSFFQDIEEDDDGNITSCKMHVVLHDLFQFLTKDECFTMESESAEDIIEASTNKVRHLTVMFASEGPISVFNYKNLCTLTTFDSNITTIDPDQILHLKYLRTLNLSFNNIKELPKEIGEFVHLRYIDLSHNRFLKELPSTMCNLYNLQTLRLVCCTRLKRLPEPMGKLINLRHLHVKDSHQLKFLPKGIRRLTSLRTLDEYFAVDGGDNKEAFKVRDLGILDQLQGSLSIKKLGNVKDAGEVKKARLQNKADLFKLEIDFENEEEEQRTSDPQILNALPPHQNLKSLCIGCYDGVTDSPNWIMSLHNLGTLILDEWKYCEVLPPLGKLQSLERLFISGMHSLKKVGFEFLGIGTHDLTAFPKLKRLSFQRMHEWKDWEGVGELGEEDSQITVMPCLSSLQINSCSLLETLPYFLRKTPLHDLGIHWCPILARGCQKGEGKEWLKISDIPNIKIDCKSVRNDGVWIQQDRTRA